MQALENENSVAMVHAYAAYSDGTVSDVTGQPGLLVTSSSSTNLAVLPGVSPPQVTYPRSLIL